MRMRGFHPSSLFRFGLTKAHLPERIVAMLFQSQHLQLTAEYGIATLWLGFPGESANALDLARLRDLDTAFRAVATIPSVRILVIRSVHANGFCTGIRPEVLAGLIRPADRAAFAWYGQQVADRLAQLNAVTLAFIDGTCLGAGLELALACDYRLCVARPTTHLGFPDRLACFGASGRLRRLMGRRRADRFLTSGQTISGREASARNLVHLAFCERRSRIELRSFLDRLELRPIKPSAPGDPSGLAAERRTFASFNPKALPASPAHTSFNPIATFPEALGLLGDDVDAARLAAEAVLEGRSVIVCGNRGLVEQEIIAARSRGFITPLEAEQAQLRVRSANKFSEFRRAGLIFVAEGHNLYRLASKVLPRAVLCRIRSQADHENPVSEARAGEELPYLRRILDIRFGGMNRIAVTPASATDSDVVAAFSAWLRLFNRSVFMAPPARDSLASCKSMHENPLVEARA
jgi:enoyl-CoA hydratase